MLKFIAPLALCATLGAFQAHAGSLLSEKSEAWLKKHLDVSKQFAISLTRNKIKFSGCQQKDYRLSMSAHLSDNMSVETLVLYGRGQLDFGVFNQRVTSRSYELISWWNNEDFRYGIATGLRPAHDLDLPMSGSLALPDSRTLSVYLETDGFREDHVVSFALRRETWLGSTSDLTLDWDKSYDNQLQFGYRINF